MPDAEAARREPFGDAGSTGYPPAHHVLRDLDVTTEQVTAEESISLAPVPDAARNAAGAASLGFLVAVLDVNAARVALVAGRPDWTATADLGLHATGWLTAGPALIESRLARAGSNTVVVTSEIFDGRGIEDFDDLATEKRTRHAPARVGRGVITFARIPARASVTAGRFDPAALIGQRRHVGPAVAPEPVPLRERVGLRVVDAPRGVVELDNHDYVRNSFGTINGGVLGIVFECAAESAVADLVATDVQIHYLAQAKVGPARTEVDVLRRVADHAVCAIRAVDAGNDDHLLALATVTLQRPP
jgi:acyl-coenzyme A thioesterase PaaI-like protein